MFMYEQVKERVRDREKEMPCVHINIVVNITV